MHLYLLPAFPCLSEEKYRIANENCGIIKLQIHPDGTITVNCINDTGHLGESVSRDQFVI